MKIQKLRLTNFRKFKELELDFDSKLNIIIGPNEQGKSTVASALIAGLFYDPLKKPSNIILRNQQWKNEKLYTIEITFTVGDDEYYLTKNFEEKQLLLRGPEGESYRTFPEVHEKISEITGFSQPTLYESSACIYQDRVAQIHSSKSELAQVLQELVTSGKEDVNVLQISRALTRELNRLKKGWDRRVEDPGPLRRTQDMTEETEKRLESLKITYNDVEKKQQQNSEMREKRDKLGEKETVLKKLVDDNQDVHETEKELNLAREAYKETEKKHEALVLLEKKKEELNRNLEQYQGWDPRDISKKVQELSNLQAVVEAREEDLEGKSASEPYPAARGKLDKIYFVVAGVLFALGILGFVIHAAFFGMFLAGLIFIALAVTEQSKKRDVGVEVTGSETQSHKDVESMKKKMRVMLDDLGVENYSDFERRYAQYSDLQDELKEAKSRQDELSKQGEQEQLESKKSDLGMRVIGFEKKLSDHDVKKKLDPKKLVEAENMLKEVSEKRDHFDEVIRSNEAIIKNANIDESEIRELEDRMKEYSQEKKRLQGQIMIYDKVCETMDEAEKKTMSSARDVLEKSIQAQLPKLTGGRYSKVRVGPSLELEVYSEELGDFIDPNNNLSRGTIDQIYLLARFALAQAQAEGKQPPFILDDPFVTFDDARKKEAMQILKEKAEDFQTFLFTYSDEYNKDANRIIHLT
ncbi:ATP-binding protein [Patescibacteria group bacterium]